MAATHVSALITRSEDGKRISIQPIKSSVEAVMSLFHRQQTVRTESSSHLTETWTQDLLNVPRNNHSPRKSSLLNLQDRRLKEQFTQKEKGGKVSFQIHFGSSGLQETLSLLDELYGAVVVFSVPSCFSCSGEWCNTILQLFHQHAGKTGAEEFIWLYI